LPPFPSARQRAQEIILVQRSSAWRIEPINQFDYEGSVLAKKFNYILLKVEFY
jgi:hypothetical protein